MTTMQKITRMPQGELADMLRVSEGQLLGLLDDLGIGHRAGLVEIPSQKIQPLVDRSSAIRTGNQPRSLGLSRKVLTR